MLRSIVLGFILLLVLSSSVMAGFGSGYYSPTGSGTVIGAVQVEGEGVYNLVVTLEFLRRPQDTKTYKSDAYEQLIGFISIKWRKIALDKILEVGPISVSDLASLKKTIEADLEEMVEVEKKKFSLGKDIEVIYTLSNFLLLEPRDD